MNDNFKNTAEKYFLENSHFVDKLAFAFGVLQFDIKETGNGEEFTYIVWINNKNPLYIVISAVLMLRDICKEIVSSVKKVITKWYNENFGKKASHTVTFGLMNKVEIEEYIKDGN